MERACCASCFADRGLKNSIIPARLNQRGNCSYCGEKNCGIVSPDILSDVFGQVLATYEQAGEGQRLIDLLRDDWRVFNPSLREETVQALLADVFGTPGIGSAEFVPSLKYSSDRLERWEELREELMHKNRYFPKVPLDEDRVESLFGQLLSGELQRNWFRARLQTGDEVFTLAEMGAPARRIAAHGRANPAGIPYLYLGSSPETAAAEIRPHRGERASIATFNLAASLAIVDLRNDPRDLVSPFVLNSEDEVGRLRSDIPFLASLGEELARPIVPIGAPIDYVPSQYLCEFIKQCGYAGVIYRSSLSDGINLALFDPESAIAVSVAPYEVSGVEVTIGPFLQRQ